MRAEAGAHAAQIFFDLAAGARCGAGANHGGGHFRKAGRRVRDDGIAAAEIKLRGDFRERARFGQHDLQAVRQRANGALRPGDGRFPARARERWRANELRMRRAWSSRTSRSHGPAYEDRAIARHQIFLRDRLHLLGRDGEKTIEHRVHAIADRRRTA